jgi:hypothetical protein
MKVKIILIVVLVALFAFGYNYFGNRQEAKLGSRLWMEYAMDIVRETKPTPPEAARFYATVSTVYFNGLQESKKLGYDQKQTQEYTNLLMLHLFEHLYPSKNASTTKFAIDNNISSKMDFGMKTEEQVFKEFDILSQVSQRYDFDNRQKNTKKFTGPEYWTGTDPLSPSAPNWERWNISSTTFQIVPPPKYLSEEYMQSLKQVHEAAQNRTTEQSALINFWGGVPGTETPAGIWQNRFYNETKNKNLSDEKYAYAQMVLSQALADSFMECWKVKFTYYTKRPNMVDTGINLAMKNPNFPSYTSGHSTVSATAATVLGYLFPDKKEVFMQDAVNAKNSRLWAGIHFPHDNEEGFKLGEEIGDFYVKNVIKK